MSANGNVPDLPDWLRPIGDPIGEVLTPRAGAHAGAVPTTATATPATASAAASAAADLPLQVPLSRTRRSNRDLRRQRRELARIVIAELHDELAEQIAGIDDGTYGVWRHTVRTGRCQVDPVDVVEDILDRIDNDPRAATARYVTRLIQLHADGELGRGVPWPEADAEDGT